MALRPSSDRPLLKLSCALLGTYKHINDVYYKTQQEAQADSTASSTTSAASSAHAAGASGAGATGKPGPNKQSGYTDENADFRVRAGDVLADNYDVIQMLGKGSFGQVVKAWDRTNNEYVAVKIIKNKTPFYNQAQIEIRLLTHMCQLDQTDQYFIVRFKHHFIDLKPENILLRNPKRSAIKVIDFGSSCHSKQTMYKYIQSRFYRSPEVVLELTYGHAIDMWSLGCILVEMHTGEPLFPGRNEYDLVYKMVEVLGFPPDHMIEGSKKMKNFFTFRPFELGGPKYKLKTDKCVKGRPFRDRPLDQVLGAGTGGPGGRRLNDPGHTDTDYQQFLDVLRACLHYDPTQRATPGDVLRMPFFESVRAQFAPSSGPLAEAMAVPSVPPIIVAPMED